MRNALNTFLALGLTAGLASGCLSDLIPSHQGSVAADAGVPSGSGGGKGDGTGGGNGTGGGKGDGGGGGMDDAGTPRADCVNRVTADNLADGHHNPGQNCITCHNGNIANAPKYYISGTLYDSVTGGAAYAGGTITWTDKNGLKGQATVMANGNFYVEDAVVFPIQVKTTSCPTTTPMVGAVLDGQGSCNSCHNSTMQIHIP